MIIINGQEINTEQELEAAIADLNDYNKDVLRAEFFGTAYPTPPLSCTVPLVLTPRQIRLELLEHGITESDMDTLLNTLQSPTKEQALIEWKYALEFRWDNPLLNQVAAMLNFTQDDINHLFIDGATK
jgi:hypothetical protein